MKKKSNKPSRAKIPTFPNGGIVGTIDPETGLYVGYGNNINLGLTLNPNKSVGIEQRGQGTNRYGDTYSEFVMGAKKNFDGHKNGKGFDAYSDFSTRANKTALIGRERIKGGLGGYGGFNYGDGEKKDVTSLYGGLQAGASWSPRRNKKLQVFGDGRIGYSLNGASNDKDDPESMYGGLNGRVRAGLKYTFADGGVINPENNYVYNDQELMTAFPEEYQQYQMAYGGNIPQHGFGQWLGRNAGTIGAVAGGIGGFLLAGPAGASAGAKLGSMAGGKISERQAEKDAEKLQAEQSGVAPMTPEIVEPEVVRKESSIGMFPNGGKLTKRQAKRAKEGKKGRYIKEGPLTFEHSRRLDAMYPSTEMLPVPFLNPPAAQSGMMASNYKAWQDMGVNFEEDERLGRAFKEEKFRRKRNFNEDFELSVPDIMYPMQMKLGGSTPSQFEAEGGEVIQGDGMQINGGGGNPSLSYRADGGAMINGVDHKESSEDPNSGVKMATSGATEGRIFSKKLKSPTTKRPFSEEADKLLKKIGKYENVIKNKSSEAISRRTSQIMADKYNAKLDELFEEQEEMKAEQGIPAQPGRAEEAGEFAKALDANAVPPNAPTPETLDMMAQQMSQMPMEEMGGNLNMFPNGGSLNLNAYRSGNENGDTVATDLELRTKNRLRAAINGEIPIQDNSKFKVNRLSVGYNQPTKKGNFGVEVNSYPSSRKQFNPELNTSYNYSNKKGNFNLGINNVMRKDSYFNPNLSMQYNFAYGGYTGQGGYRNAALDFYNNQEPDQGGLSEEALAMMDKTKDKEGNALDGMPEITTEDKKDATEDIAKSTVKNVLMKSVMAAAGIPPIAKYGGKLPQHGDGSALKNIGAGVGAATPLPTMFYDFAQGRKDPYEWERLQNEQKQNALNQFGNASGNLGTMGETVGNMDSQAVRDFQASRDIYAGMGDLDVSQQRADASNAAGNQMYALRGGAGSRAEMLAGAQNVQGQRQAQMGSIEAYKNKFDLDTQKMKAAGMNQLGSSEGSLQSQKASLYGSLAGQQGMLGGMYQNMGQQDREYDQYVNELNKQEIDLRNMQKRSGWAGLDKFIKGAGTAMIGMGTNKG